MPPRAVTFTSGLDHPWGLAFLPDGRMLVTERPGACASSAPTADAVESRWPGCASGARARPGRPARRGDRSRVRRPRRGSTGALPKTAPSVGHGGGARPAARAPRSSSVQVIFRQLPKVVGRRQQLWLAAGVRQRQDPVRQRSASARPTIPTAPTADHAQKPGQPPGQGGSYQSRRHGARRQSLRRRDPARCPRSGASATATCRARRCIRSHRRAVAQTSMARSGGDEINRIVARHNYGWPLRSYGCPEGSTLGTGCAIGGGTHSPNFDEPLDKWVPTSTAPERQDVLHGDAFPSGRPACSSARWQACRCGDYPWSGNNGGRATSSCSPTSASHPRRAPRARRLHLPAHRERQRPHRAHRTLNLASSRTSTICCSRAPRCAAAAPTKISWCLT